MAVAIRKGGGIKENLEGMFGELNFNPGERVFVKPNLSGRNPVLPGENTSVEVMDALVKLLLEKGKKVMIGHGAILGSQDHKTTFEETIKWAGFDKYRNINNVSIVNLDDLERAEVSFESVKYHLPLKLLSDEVNTYINLAKIKTHMETGVSFSLKNQMGLPAPLDRVAMHKTDLERTIAGLALNCKPDLNILEGFPAMENNGPHHGTPLELNLLVAGDDMVELDSFVCEILRIDSGSIKHIQHAKELGAGSIFDKNRLEEYESFLVDNFHRASNVYKFGRQIRAYPTYSCSRCINAVNLAGREFKKHPLKYWKFIFAAIFGRKRINIVFGKADELKYSKGACICIGNCAKNFADYYGFELLDKCPPGIDETREYILKNTKKKDK